VLETFTRESFASRLNEHFRLELDAARILDLELVELTSLGAQSAAPPRPGVAPRAPFSVVFRGPRDPVLPQRIYRLQHAEIGTFELFLVPIGRDASGTRYEAVFT
jgi:hypothetical protein